jgi:signal transduction histidine kinase
LRAIVDNLGQIITLFEIYAERVDDSIRDNFLLNIDDLRRWQTFVQQQVNLLAFLLGKQARLEQQPHNVKMTVDDVVDALKGYQDDYGITVRNKVPANLMSPPMYLAELHAIIINVLTNALKAVRGCEQREIEVRAGTRDRSMYIQMLDTGKGLDIAREKAFLPFETTSSPDSILGEGTGLGLYVVRALVSNYNGAAQFIDAPADWRTCIEIELPKEYA